MAKRTGLGRGIGALIPTADQSERPVDVFFPGAPKITQDAATTASSAEKTDAAPAPDLTAIPGITLIQVDPKKIVPNPRQPRTHFDEDHLAELVHSVREFGVLQPVVVRRNGEGDFELIMGERRTRAAREAGLDAIPAILRETADEDLLRDALLENLHRSQLNPLEEASAYQQLLEDFGITQEELASRIGRSRPQISNTLRLLKLSPAVQRRVAAGVLSAGHARSLLGVDDAALQDQLAQRVVAEGISVRGLEEIVALREIDGAKQPKRRSARLKGPAPELNSFADRLADRFETSVKVDMGRAKGKITVEFATLEDLQRIVDIMDPRNRNDKVI